MSLSDMPVLNLAWMLDQMTNFQEQDHREWKKRMRAWDTRNKKAVPQASMRAMMAPVFGLVEMLVNRFEFQRKQSPALQPMEEKATSIGRMIGNSLPPGVGFLLMLFTFGEGGFTTFMSNAKREDMLAELKDFFEKLEAQR